ncbi:MAG: bifunctional riboflavin kinase/FAD synthetase [Deltaproteobacteria bacterium]|nr:bifunctional riboflavin kinase/FAD synthetase [Deltaproteobacteria bacterium]
MKIFRANDDIHPTTFIRPVVTIGNFDGCHLGHQEIFGRLNAHVSDIDGTSIVYTFDPHPATIIFDDHDLKLVFTLQEKIEAIESMGIDALIITPFTQEFANITPEAFIKDIIVGMIGAKGVVVGHDFSFGKNNEGNVVFLKRMAKDLNFFVDKVDEVIREGVVVSSSSIRNMIQLGDVGCAKKLMGYPYRLPGEVIHGKSRGHSLGYPTANIRPFKTLIPAQGVYVAYTYIEGQRMPGVVNIGYNPTFGDQDLSVEVYVFDIDQDMYGKSITIEFIDRLRGEIKFPDSRALARQIEADCVKARETLEKENG